MAKHTRTWTMAMGLDVSDRWSHWARVDEEGEVVERGRVATAAPELRKQFAKHERCLVALEAGTHSAWMSRVLRGLGFEVVVANPRQVALIAKSVKKNDRMDAETLARLARLDVALLSPIEHRGQEAQDALATLHARNLLVAQRTQLVNHIRATVKTHGERLPASSAPSFHKSVAKHIPESLRAALLPLVAQVARLTLTIQRYDDEVERLGREVFPESMVLRQVHGVGPVTALTYVLVLEDRTRFKRSRQVGSYLGLVPRQRESGESRPQLRITKTGNQYLRTLLVQCAHYILGPFGKDNALRRWGLSIAGEGSQAKKKRAVIAVARKLAVILHRLWVTGEVYEPFHGKGVVMEAA
jgi:transposase